MALALLLIGIALVLFLAYILNGYILPYIRKRKRIINLVEKIPGPPAIPFLGNTHQFKLDKVEFSYQLEQLISEHSTNGVCRFWLGPWPVVFITTAEASDQVLSSTSLITKSDLGYGLLKKWLGDGLLISSGAKWKSRRRMLTPTFHFSILNSFVDIHVETARVLVDQLQPMADTGTCFDIFPFLGRAALDDICESAMGVKLGAQKDKESDYVKAVQSMSEIIFKHERMPWLRIKPIFYLLGYGAQYDRNLALLKGFTRKVIEERSAQIRKRAKDNGVPLSELKPTEGKKFAFLDLLLIMQDENHLTFEDIADEVDTFMFEGHDTTASGMGWTVFLLGHNPDVQAKICEEMDLIFGDSDRLPTPDDLKAMKYLEQVVKEGLRLYPPVPMFGRNVTEDFYSGGYMVPKGSIVFLAPFLIHRDPDNFTDPEVFRPERFDPVNQANRHPFSYVPFSAGSRNCIGQKFALMEEKAILSQIVRNFEIKSLEPREDVRAIPDVILRPPDKFLVRLTRRT